MTREEAIEELKAIKSVYSNNLFGDAKLMKSEQDALDMAIKALEQEPNCPFYKIDEDGHGLCKNNRYMEDVLGKIIAEIEQNAYPIVHGVNNHEKGMTLYGILQVIDKYKAESDHTCHTCKHYLSGEQDGSCDSYICEHYSGWEARDKE